MALRGDIQLQSVARTFKTEDAAVAFSAVPGLEIPIFAWTGERIVIDTLNGCQEIGERQIFGVHLDDGSAVFCTADTAFIVRDGTAVSAAELQPGDALMPLYLSKDSHGYPVYKEPNPVANKFAPCSIDRAPIRKISRLVAEWRLGHPLEPGTYVEHIDGNRENCHPDNLKISFKPENTRKSTNYGITQVVEEATNFIQEVNADKSLKKNSLPDNHSVDYIEIMGLEPVYELTGLLGTVAVSGVFISTICC